MEEEFTLSPEDIHCASACEDCPYFLRLDICGYAYAQDQEF